MSGVTALVLAGAIPAGASAQQPAKAAPPLVFDGVTVVDVAQGKLVPDQRVVIAGHRIQAVGSVGALKTPAEAQVVDARGKYLIPGLWDMHAHVISQNPEGPYWLFIANGVTGIREMGTTIPLDERLRWRQEIAAGVRIGPREILTGGSLNTPAAANNIPVETPAEARQVVDSLKAAGADFIKVRDGLSAEVYFAIAAEARRIGIPFAGHLPGSTGADVTPFEASDSGQRSVEHVNEFPAECTSSPKECTDIAARFARNGTWFTPTLALVLRLGIVDSASEFVHMMHRAGVPLLTGSDIPGLGELVAGQSLHEELASLVGAGLTPLEALQAATLNPAKYLKATDSLGTVAQGKLADLVLLDANPLADISSTTKIRAVVANGHYFDRIALDKLLANVKAKATAEEP